MRQHKRIAVDAIYQILNVRVVGIQRVDVVNELTCMGYEGLIKIDYEPVAILRD